jgi:hypothetical protein
MLSIRHLITKLVLYKFQYTKVWDIVIVIILATLILISIEILGLYLNINDVLSIVGSFVLAFLFFQIFKKLVVRTCKATLHESFIEFEFKKSAKLISFSNLVSFKNQEGKNGPILYLKTQTEDFEIFANSKFCKTEKFKIFSDNAIIQLQKYQENNDLKPNIHQITKKQNNGYLYFLIIASVVYLFLITVLDNNSTAYLFILGGFFLFITWFMYFVKRLINYFKFRRRMVKV